MVIYIVSGNASLGTHSDAQNRRRNISILGITAMIVLSLSQLIPHLQVASYGVLVGIAVFFIDCVISKRRIIDSGLNFTTFIAELKKPGLFPWLLILMVTAVLPALIGDVLLNLGYSAHILGRVAQYIRFEDFLLLGISLIVLALGEEIAWRGFFVGKSMKKFPFLSCALVSSFLFAIGHFLKGEPGVVVLYLLFVFIDSMIFAIVFKKSGNCAVSALFHVLSNVVALGVCFSLA